MEHIARTVKQTAAVLRRERRKQSITQGQLGKKIGVRQATISRLESGEDAVSLQTLMDTLTALNLELVIRPRTKASVKNIEDIF